jgi:uncharacterized lipoprotein YajG
MRNLGIVALCAALGGCATAPAMLWVRSDGQSVRENPVFQTQFELDSTACLGERNKASLSGVTFTGGGLAGVAAAQNRSDAADTVQRGCMAEKGYLLVAEDQAEAKRAELATVAAEKRRQELAAAAPPAKPRKPAAPKPAPTPAPPATQ